MRYQDVYSVERNPDDATKFSVVFFHRYNFEVDTEDQVQRVLDSFENFRIPHVVDGRRIKPEPVEPYTEPLDDSEISRSSNEEAFVERSQRVRSTKRSVSGGPAEHSSRRFEEDLGARSEPEDAGTVGSGKRPKSKSHSPVLPPSSTSNIPSSSSPAHRQSRGHSHSPSPTPAASSTSINTSTTSSVSATNTAVASGNTSIGKSKGVYISPIIETIEFTNEETDDYTDSPPIYSAHPIGAVPSSQAQSQSTSSHEHDESSDGVSSSPFTHPSALGLAPTAGVLSPGPSTKVPSGGFISAFQQPYTTTTPPSSQVIGPKATSAQRALLKPFTEAPSPRVIAALSRSEAEQAAFMKRTQSIGPAPSLDDFELLRLIGTGSFAKVLLVRHKATGQLFAMKVLKKEELFRRNQIDHTKTERLILATLRHPFMVKLRYSFQTDHKLYMVLDFVRGGELFYHLRRAGKFSEEQTRFYVAQVVLALDYLHRHDVIYRDLKPENILLGHDGHIKLTDFGLSKKGITSVGGKGEGQTATTFCGTPEYLAPEIITGIGHGKAVDWWSVGILAFEMLNGKPPFSSQNRNQLYINTIKGQITWPEGITEEARDLLSKLLHRRPEERLGSNGVEEIQNHPFFANLDWEDVYHRRVAPPFLPNSVDANWDLSGPDFNNPIIVSEWMRSPSIENVENARKAQNEFVDFSFTGSQGGGSDQQSPTPEDAQNQTSARTQGSQGSRKSSDFDDVGPEWREGSVEIPSSGGRSKATSPLPRKISVTSNLGAATSSAIVAPAASSAVLKASSSSPAITHHNDHRDHLLNDGGGSESDDEDKGLDKSDDDDKGMIDDDEEADHSSNASDAIIIEGSEYTLPNRLPGHLFVDSSGSSLNFGGTPGQLDSNAPSKTTSLDVSIEESDTGSSMAERDRSADRKRAKDDERERHESPSIRERKERDKDSNSSVGRSSPSPSLKSRDTADPSPSRRGRGDSKERSSPGERKRVKEKGSRSTEASRSNSPSVSPSPSSRNKQRSAAQD